MSNLLICLLTNLVSRLKKLTQILLQSSIIVPKFTIFCTRGMDKTYNGFAICFNGYPILAGTEIITLVKIIITIYIYYDVYCISTLIWWSWQQEMCNIPLLWYDDLSVNDRVSAFKTKGKMVIAHKRTI